MNILGISISPSDHGFCFLRDGAVQSAVQNISFSAGSFEVSLQQAGIVLGDVDLLAVCDKPILQWQRIMKASLSQVPEGSMMFLKEALPWIRRHAWMKKTFGPKSAFHGEVLFVGRHQSLVAAAFSQSNLSDAAFLTFDTGVELVTSCFGVGALDDFCVQAEQYYPHSLELFCSAFMPVTGVVRGDVNHFLGLASKGKADYADLLFAEFMDLKEDGSFRLDMNCFNYRNGLTVSSTGLSRLIGCFNDNAEISARDLARSVQIVAETILSRTLKYLYYISGKSRLCILGSGTSHCLGGDTVWENSAFDEVSVEESGNGAVGAALFVWQQYLRQQSIKSLPVGSEI